MNFNPLLFPTLALALFLFWAGERLSSRSSNTLAKVCVLFGSFVLAVPCALMPLYYFHLFDKAKWFYEFRAFPCSEFVAAGAGLFAGVIIGCTTRWFRWFRIIAGALAVGLLGIGITVPYLKPMVCPILSTQFSNRWTEGVCRQSTGSSCGAASTATVLKALGVEVTEAEIAKECFTYLGGTENWFIARAFSKRGFGVKYRIEKGFPADLHLPAIAGVDVGSGHFIAILSETESSYVTGDPLVGRREFPKRSISNRYHFTGFFMEIRKKY